MNMQSFKWIFAAVAVSALCLPTVGKAQSPRTIDAGTTIVVRINQAIRIRYSDGRVYSGVVNRDVRSRAGRVAIARGSKVELVVRTISRSELALDLESIELDGQPFGIEAEDRIAAPD